MRNNRVHLAVLVACLSLGCQDVKRALPGATWHERVGWKAEDYFGDPAVIELCRAIDHKIYRSTTNQRLVPFVLADEQNRGHSWSPKHRADFERLLRWLENHGESIEEARQDRERWQSWSMHDGEFARNMAVEVAGRKEREAREQPEEDAVRP
ncbi:MAG: hypothetical protein DWQ37_01255 [Planctomycetota bacterium]|nr:MAG: hypothetical protein DWQ37_01255 [Planctomycetota bacterium]